MSMAASTVLVSGLASTLYISSHALDESVSHRQSTRAGILLNDLMSDLTHAQIFLERSPTTLRFVVPDRDGDGLQETIRYSWSGTAGDPLVYQYNDRSARNLAESVHYFNIESLTRDFLAPVTGSSEPKPVILFVSESAESGSEGLAAASSSEQSCIDLLQSWGYDTLVVSQQANQASFDTHLSEAVVVYVAGNVSGATLGTKLDATSLGIVMESVNYCEQSGMTGSTTFDSNSNVEIAETGHYITQEQTLGVLAVTNSSVEMKYSINGVAAGGMQLADVNYTTTPYPSLLAVSPSAQLVGGGTAIGRRVQLPWGTGGFNVSNLNASGENLLQRSVAWAAGAGDDMYPPMVTLEESTLQQEGSNTSSITIPVPSGTQEGDLLIAALVTDGDANGFVADSGWTLIQSGDYNGRVSVGVWYKLAEVSEPSSYTFTWGRNEKALGWMMRFTGHDPTDPIPVFSTSSEKSSTPASPNVITFVENSMILRIGGFDDDDITLGDAGVSGHTTIVADQSDSSLFSCSGAAAYTLQGMEGNSGVAAFTLEGSEESWTITIVIQRE